jgi:hypothetical protein
MEIRRFCTCLIPEVSHIFKIDVFCPGAFRTSIKKRSHLLILLFSTLYVILNIQGLNTIMASDCRKVKVSPLFDGYVGNGKPVLKLAGCRGYERFYNTNEGQPARMTTKYGIFEPRKWTYAEESWEGPSCLVTIKRWHFDNPKDASLYPYAMILPWADVPAAFPGWDNHPSWEPATRLGNKTCWVASSLVYFVEGNVLVYVRVNPFDSGAKFTAAIAKRIADKL